MSQNQIYIYLARKDKKGIKTIASFSNNTKCFPTIVEFENLDKLNLSDNVKNAIYQEINSNKLIYDIYVESSTSFEELRKSLIGRGYKNIPFQQISRRLNKGTMINKDSLVTEKSTMIRRNSDHARRT
jgi:hypothetical protein